MTTPKPDQKHHDSDEHMGAVEGDRPEDTEQGNRNAGALDDEGLPKNKRTMCEDAIGANNDETQG